MSKKGTEAKSVKREVWSSELGVILAVAGSAVGLGNFLRFPVQAANNGGGAFMIPYFISLLLLGIPLMWIEWAIGRHGGAFGHGTAPGAFDVLSKHRWIKYLGVIGILGPLIIFIYYTYIESWLVGYIFFSMTGKYFGLTSAAQLSGFLNGYQGVVKNEYFSSIAPAYIFFVATFMANMYVIKKGISGGIEKLSTYGMPLLVIIGFVLMVRVLFLGAPDSAHPDWNIWNGLGFLWNPDFSQLLSAKVWMAAAGQIFFTLSVGIGVIITYASYLKKKDDIALSGLTSVSANEFCEVIFGGSIVIPAAFAFFGPIAILGIAQSGTFNLGFVTMPMIFEKIPFGMVFATIWFLLLFIAGITSSVSLIQPVMSFVEDEFKQTREKALRIVSVVSFVLCQPAIFFLSRGVLDDLDFWGGTFCLVLFATIETILFMWVFGEKKAWEEIHHGAQLYVPKVYLYIMKYITPLFLLLLWYFWLTQEGLNTVLMKNVKPENIFYILGTRIGLLVLLLALVILVKIAWERKKK
ncbi:MAG: sodium-dependent transporter [Candidatus Margulisiibacteriota bacterium]